MYKKQNFLLVLSATLIVGCISFNLVAKGKRVFTLDNKKIQFQVEASSGVISLNYILNGISHSAVTIAVQIKDGKGSLKYQLENEGQRNGILLFTADNGKKGRFYFYLGEKTNYLQLTKFKNIAELKLDFNSAALLLPDNVSEDMVIYPDRWKPTTITIPGDFYLAINMLDNGQALFSCLWDAKRLRPVQLKSKNSFSSIMMQPTEKDNIWLGLNAAPGIWYKCRRKLSSKEEVIDWVPPFAADWKMTLLKLTSRFPTENGQYDTWPMAVIVKDKIIQRVTGLMNTRRQAWYANLGTFQYPIVERDGKVSIVTPQFQRGLINYNQQFQPLIYPLAATKNSPKTVILPLDMRKRLLPKSTLEQLQVIRSPDSRYPATCGVTHAIEKIFYRDEEKKSKEFIIKRLNLMDNFVVTGRRRINDYREFGKKLRQQLDRFKRQFPNNAQLIKSLQKDLFELEVEYAKREEKIKTPPYCRMLADKIIRLVEDSADNEIKENRCKQIGREIRIIGGNQDHLLADEQGIVKALRQRVTMLLLDNPTPAQRQILEFTRQATAKIMHSKFTMEGKNSQRMLSSR